MARLQSCLTISAGFRTAVARNSCRALLAVLLPLLLGFAFPGEYGRLIEAANAAYSRQRFADAADRYAKAAELEPDRPEPLFGRGAARYRLGEFESALADCIKAAGAASGQLRQYAEYNAGNCAYRVRKLDEAIAHYKRALTLDPSDPLAKHNLEMALRAQQQENQQQSGQRDKQRTDQKQKRDQQQKQPQEQAARPQSQNQEPQEPESPNQEAESSNAQTQPEQGAAEQRPAQQAQGGDAGQMTAEQAARLLSALAQEDSSVQRAIQRMPLGENRRMEEPPTGKDW